MMSSDRQYKKFALTELLNHLKEKLPSGHIGGSPASSVRTPTRSLYLHWNNLEQRSRLT